MKVGFIAVLNNQSLANLLEAQVNFFTMSRSEIRQKKKEGGQWEYRAQLIKWVETFFLSCAYWTSLDVSLCSQHLENSLGILVDISTVLSGFKSLPFSTYGEILLPLVPGRGSNAAQPRNRYLVQTRHTQFQVSPHESVRISLLPVSGKIVRACSGSCWSSRQT